MAFKNFFCSNCASVKLASHSPKTNGCKKVSGFHNWRDLGFEGTVIFNCGNCLATINSDETPTKFGCPSEKGLHIWKILTKKKTSVATSDIILQEIYELIF